MKKGTYRDLLIKAKRHTKRQPNGDFVEEDLHANVKKLIDIDVDQAKDRLAKAIIDSETRPGSTDSVGSLWLPTMEPYDYEPERLIRNDEGGPLLASTK